MKVDKIVKEIRKARKRMKDEYRGQWLKEIEEAFVSLCEKGTELGKGEELQENVIQIFHEWAMAYERMLWEAFWWVFLPDIFKK